MIAILDLSSSMDRKEPVGGRAMEITLKGKHNLYRLFLHWDDRDLSKKRWGYISCWPGDVWVSGPVGWLVSAGSA